MKQRKFFVLQLLIVCLALLSNHKLPGEENNAGKLRFVVYGDTRTNDTAHRQVVEAALKQQPSFIVQTGDLVETSSDASQWATFDRTIQPIRGNGIRYYPAKGNHDVKGSKFVEEILDPIQPGDDGKNYYRFDVGGLRFIALDSESLAKDAVALNTGPFSKNTNCEEAKSKGAMQFCWLKKQLEQSKIDKVSVIPFFHRALFSVGKHGSDISLQNLLHPLFKKFGVRLVFQGHDHLYYHTIRDGITYIVTGGGGAPLYKVSKEKMQPGDVAKKAYHICSAELSGDDIHIIVYEVEGKPEKDPKKKDQKHPKKKDPVKPIDDFHVSLVELQQ